MKNKKEFVWRIFKVLVVVSFLAYGESAGYINLFELFVFAFILGFIVQDEKFDLIFKRK